MNITLYESASLFDDACGEWGELLADSAANQIFLTCEWQAAWWTAYHPGEVWILVLRDDDGRWLGIAPWFRATDEHGTRMIRTIGCVDVTDYLDIIARHGHEDAVYEALAAWLAAHTAEFDLIQLCNIPESSRALARFPDFARDHGLAANVRLQEVCPVVTLPDTFEEYLAGLDKKNRHELRRKLRRAAGQVDWYIVGPEHDLEAEMATFLTLMAASSPDKAVFLEDAENQDFFKRMVPEMAQRGWLQLAFLTVDGNPASAYLNFDYADRILVYNSGLNPDDHGRLSPGIILLARLIEHAIAQRRSEFDFLRGDEAYKYDMGGQDTKVFQIEIDAGAGA